MSGYDKVTPMMAAALEVESTSPAMASYIESLFSQPDPNMAIGVSIRKAFINELDPKKYPEMAGRWPQLRKAFRARTRKSAGLSGLGDGAGGSVAGSVVGAVSDLAGTLLTVAMQKYQMDKMRKEQRKEEAREREAAAAAAKAAQAEATRNALMAKLAARTGGVSTVAGTTAVAQQIADENAVKAVSSMARQEMAVQQQIDNNLVSQGNVQTAALVALPVGAMMVMR